MTPPMDPSTNDNNNERQFCLKHSKNLNTICSSFNSQRSRPTDLPGLNAGLTTVISSNYGERIFDQQINNQDEQQQIITDNFKNISSNLNSTYSVDSLSDHFTPLVAAYASFRHPQIVSQQFHNIPSLYSPYDGSQSSDPNTPTQQFNNSIAETSSMISSLNLQSPQNLSNCDGLLLPPPTYASTISSMAAAVTNNTTPFDAFFWNWPPLFGCTNGNELIGYNTAIDHQNNLLFNSTCAAAQHLLTPPFDFCTTQQQQIDCNSSIILDNNTFQHQQHQLWLAEQFAEAAAINNNNIPSCVIKKERQQANTITKASTVFVPPLSLVSKPKPLKASVSTMPRGQPRRGGRVPRERINVFFC
jgi:hypothetical protein